MDIEDPLALAFNPIYLFIFFSVGKWEYAHAYSHLPPSRLGPGWTRRSNRSTPRNRDPGTRQYVLINKVQAFISD